jgi:acyl-CoA dehydrogenase
MDFEHSERAQIVMEQVERFVRERIVPNETTYRDQLSGSDDWRQWRVPPIVEALKAEARALGLWNLFMPDPRYGAGLDNRDYAPIAELTGRSFIAPEVFNCNAPDTGNAEVLVQYGSDEQKARWLTPLLAGEIRSGFSMTEPAVASSDATNMAATAELDGDEVVLNGQKWWTSGAGDPRCAFLIFMGVTDPSADRHQRHSMVLVPIDSPGVRILRMLPVFGDLGEPHGHAEILFDNVRLPAERSSPGPGGASRSPRDGSAPAASITACGRSARPNGRFSASASGRFFGPPSASL